MGFNKLHALTWALLWLQLIPSIISFSPRQTGKVGKPRSPGSGTLKVATQEVVKTVESLSPPPTKEKADDQTPTVARPHRLPRVLRTVNPFRLTPTETEYLASAALYHSKYSGYNTFAFFAVEKLHRTPSLLQRAQTAALSSTKPSRVASLLYRTTRPVIVQENVETVLKDPKSGQVRGLQREVLLQAVSERIAYLVSEDLNNIREGIYPIPSELQLNQLTGPNALPSSAREFIDAFNFANADSYEGSPDYSVKRPASPYFQDLAAGLELPEYYQTDFHSVPGGFLSPKHVSIYDTLSEVVFSGTHFMARRMLLRPITEEIRAMSTTHIGGRGLRLLDMGTGTGSFLIQLREAFPELTLAGLDLSPAMLEYAATTCRAHPAFTNTQAPTLVLANMEDMPQNDASFDFVTETNCFHEIPEYAIRNIARETSRVLKEGGFFLHMDAVQMKDDASIAATSRVSFDASFNEPYMMEWMEKVDLDAIFAAEGLEPVGPAKPYYASTLRVYRKTAA